MIIMVMVACRILTPTLQHASQNGRQDVFDLQTFIESSRSARRSGRLFFHPPTVKVLRCPQQATSDNDPHHHNPHHVPPAKSAATDMGPTVSDGLANAIDHQPKIE
jgi:hypothetical protein